MTSQTKRARRWCFTLNNYTTDEYTSITERFTESVEKSIRYAIVAKEEGAEGTPHLQGYFTGTKMFSFNQAKELVSDRAHLEAAKGNEHQNFVYCSKDGNYVEYGTKSKQGKRTDLDDIAEMCENGATLLDVAQYSPATYIRNYRGIQHYKALHVKPYEHDTIRGLWIWGPPGTGKTHHALRINPESTYMKQQNKWFDGYVGEKVIVLDDLDEDWLGHYLKMWADKWPRNGEVKGGTVTLCHTHFVVTSNYSIDRLLRDQSPEMISAVKRRFKVIHMTGLVEHLNMLNPEP